MPVVVKYFIRKQPPCMGTARHGYCFCGKSCIFMDLLFDMQKMDDGKAHKQREEEHNFFILFTHTHKKKQNSLTELNSCRRLVVSEAHTALGGSHELTDVFRATKSTNLNYSTPYYQPRSNHIVPLPWHQSTTTSVSMPYT